jgi:hypothetical protein
MGPSLERTLKAIWLVYICMGRYPDQRYRIAYDEYLTLFPILARSNMCGVRCIRGPREGW